MRKRRKPRGRDGHAQAAIMASRSQNHDRLYRAGASVCERVEVRPDRVYPREHGLYECLGDITRGYDFLRYSGFGQQNRRWCFRRQA